MIRRLVLLIAAGLLALPGCGRHHQGVRPAAAPPVLEPAANDEKPPPQRINNAESQAVQNWSTGDR